MHICESNRYKCGCESGFNLILRLCKTGIRINKKQVEAYNNPGVKAIADKEMQEHLSVNSLSK